VCECECPETTSESQVRLHRIILAGSLQNIVGRLNVVKDLDKHSEWAGQLRYGMDDWEILFCSRQEQKVFFSTEHSDRS
jgi:hypothetical protein